MKNLVMKVNVRIIKVLEKLKEEKGEVSLSIILGAVATIIVFAYIVLPGVRGIVSDLWTKLDTWIDSAPIFPTS